MDQHSKDCQVIHHKHDQGLKKKNWLIAPKLPFTVSSHVMKVDCQGRELFPRIVCRIIELISMIKFHEWKRTITNDREKP